MLARGQQRLSNPWQRKHWMWQPFTSLSLCVFNVSTPKYWNLKVWALTENYSSILDQLTLTVYTIFIATKSCSYLNFQYQWIEVPINLKINCLWRIIASLIKNPINNKEFFDTIFIIMLKLFICMNIFEIKL